MFNTLSETEKGIEVGKVDGSQRSYNEDGCYDSEFFVVSESTRGTDSSGDDDSEEVNYSTSDSNGKTRRDLLEREELGADSLFAEEHKQQVAHDNVIKSPLMQYKRRGNCKKVSSTSKEAVLREGNNGEK